MSAYCTYTDVVERLKIADVGIDTATFTSATISAHITNAQNYVDGRLRGYVLIPFTTATTIPGIINEATADVAACNVCKNIFGMDYFKANDKVRGLQESAEKILTDIAIRKIDLGSGFDLTISSYMTGKGTTSGSFYFASVTTTWWDLT